MNLPIKNRFPSARGFPFRERVPTQAHRAAFPRKYLREDPANAAFENAVPPLNRSSRLCGGEKLDCRDKVLQRRQAPAYAFLPLHKPPAGANVLFECAKQGEFCGNSQRLSVRNIVRKLEFGKNNADIGCKIEGGGRRTEHCPLLPKGLNGQRSKSSGESSPLTEAASSARKVQSKLSSARAAVPYRAPRRRHNPQYHAS